MTFYDITPVRAEFTAGYGNVVEYAVTHLSDPRMEGTVPYEALTRTIEKEIRERLQGGEASGEFTTSACSPLGGYLYVRLTYCTAPQYDVFMRIYRWWYNYDSAEALSEKDFQAAYGCVLGSHIYRKWLSFRRDISKMIGYLGEDAAKGQRFLGMVMRRVRQYEQRMMIETIR